MKIPTKGLALSLVGLAAIRAPMATGQVPPGELTEAVEHARLAWLDHDLGALLELSDTIRLELPGVGQAPAVRPSQAARVLREYVQPANEISLVLRGIRSVADDHAYAQLLRRYVVRGTSDERLETVFFGFRILAGSWRLREVRIAP